VSRRSAWNVAALVLVAGMALAASACGGDSAEGTQVASLGGSSTQSETTTTGASSDDPQEILLEYTECMRDEGIDLPDPDFSGGARGGFRIQLGPNGMDPDDPEFQAARKKCEPILANLRQQFDPEEQEERQEAALEFAKCMREHGIDIPDPDFSGGGAPGRRAEGGPFGDSGVDPDDPDFRAAQEECDDVFGDRGGPFLSPGRGGGGGGNSDGGDDQ
jgi:hypothetical protein